MVIAFYATAAVTADDVTGNANSEPFEATTLLPPHFPGVRILNPPFHFASWFEIVVKMGSKSSLD
jgi:hypothetical protein